MSNLETIHNTRERDAGRVIPQWRLTLLYMITGFLIGILGVLAGIDWWWVLAVYFGWAIFASALLIRFQRRVLGA